MSSLISGAARPLPGPKHRVKQLDQGEKIDCVILSTTIWGVMTHWNDNAGKHGRSERCTKDEGYCEACEKQMPTRWKGYLHVFDFYARRDMFLELTPASCEALELQALPDAPLRGQRLIAERGHGGKRTRISTKIEPFYGDLTNLPDPVEPEGVLEKLWNWQR